MAQDTIRSRFEQLIQLFPASFYALLAAERLREIGATPPPPFPSPPKTLDVDSKELELAAQLAQAGLFRDAADEVQYRVASVRTAPAALKLGHALQKMGEFGPAHILAARLLWGSAFGSKEPDAVALFYPRPYVGTVAATAKAQSVDPYFMWSIMRRESAFRPEVMSAANARGLMQIIPSTATAIAKELSAPAPAPDDLFAPELNIRFAGWYLGALLKRFGHPALTAAAYNAGPDAVAKWFLQKGTLPLDQFVEEIPFKETRAYVKQVVADVHVYHGLYGDPTTAPKLMLTLPPPSAQGVKF